MREKTTAERGKFKKEIQTALYKNDDILELILGEEAKSMKPKELRDAFKEHVKSHLFIDDTLTETATYIFYDVEFTELHTNIKSCRVYMYLICHRDILEDYHKEGYYGDRVDILTQMVEDTLIDDPDVVRTFGIGPLNLDSVKPYNSRRFYGAILIFSVPNFR